MSKSTRFVGMDVHAETIAVAVAEGRDPLETGVGRPRHGEHQLNGSPPPDWFQSEGRLVRAQRVQATG